MKIITAASNSIGNIRTNRTTINRKLKWKKTQLYGYSKRQTDEISHEKTRIWLRKGSCERETESLLLAAQNNAIGTNYAKEKIDKTQQNGKYRLRGDRDKMIYHVISKCSKFEQKVYKTRHV